MITKEKDDCKLLIQWLWTGKYSPVARGLVSQPSLDSLDPSLACPASCHDTNGIKIPQDGQSCIRFSCGGTSLSTPYPKMISPTHLGGNVDTIVRTSNVIGSSRTQSDGRRIKPVLMSRLDSLRRHTLAADIDSSSIRACHSWTGPHGQLFIGHRKRSIWVE
jgi:hypothetical protein